MGTIAHNRKHKCKLKHCLVTTVFVGRGYVTRTLFSAVLGQFQSGEVITECLYSHTKYSCSVIKKVSNKFHQGALTIIPP